MIVPSNAGRELHGTEEKIAAACPTLGWWKDHEGWWHFEDGSRMRGGSCLSDLNAIAEAEKILFSLGEYHEARYRSAIRRLPHPKWDGAELRDDAHYATARQRADAFLLTINDSQVKHPKYDQIRS